MYSIIIAVKTSGSVRPWSSSRNHKKKIYPFQICLFQFILYEVCVPSSIFYPQESTTSTVAEPFPKAILNEHYWLEGWGLMSFFLNSQKFKLVSSVLERKIFLRMCFYRSAWLFMQSLLAITKSFTTVKMMWFFLLFFCSYCVCSLRHYFLCLRDKVFMQDNKEWTQPNIDFYLSRRYVTSSQCPYSRIWIDSSLLCRHLGSCTGNFHIVCQIACCKKAWFQRHFVLQQSDGCLYFYHQWKGHGYNPHSHSWALLSRAQ